MAKPKPGTKAFGERSRRRLGKITISGASQPTTQERLDGKYRLGINQARPFKGTVTHGRMLDAVYGHNKGKTKKKR